MKRLFAFALLALTSLAFGATTTPVSLLNPAGSTAGQVPISNGPTSAPAWGTVTLGGVSGTLSIANGGTGATSASTALSNLGGLSTTTAASTYLSQTNAASTYAALASPTFTGTPAAPTAAVATNSTQLATTGYVVAKLASPTPIGSTAPGSGAFTTLSATALITPSTTAGIKGTAAADSANAGSIGEYLPNSATSISLTSGTTATIVSLPLTAGDWDVSGVVTYTNPGTTQVNYMQQGISSTAATMPTANTGAMTAVFPSNAAGNGGFQATPVVRVNVSSATTVYLVAYTTFSTSTLTASGFIRARRVR